ncbi:MAG TPA: hypothetical protein VLY87_08095 [Flavobacterium sp.]|nr:hypothetical protein [Flavobacterium sp.]
MKKIFFLLPLFLLIFSGCNSDDNETKGTSVIKATINGVEKTFNTVTAIRSSDDSTDELYEVKASVNNDPSETISFRIYPDDLGATHYFNLTFMYTKNSNNYSSMNGSTLNVVLIDTQNRTYKGNFSGTVNGVNGTTGSVKITNESFEIYY